MRSLRTGALSLTFEQEAEIDLFMQQGVMASFYRLLNDAVALLVARGYPAEAVCTEMYLSGELAYIFEKASQVGLIAQTQTYSLTGQYGILSRYDQFNEPKQRRQLEAILEDIRNGKFAQDWAAEYAGGYPHLREHVDRLTHWPTWAMEHRALKLIAGEGNVSFDPEEDTRPGLF